MLCTIFKFVSFAYWLDFKSASIWVQFLKILNWRDFKFSRFLQFFPPLTKIFFPDLIFHFSHKSPTKLLPLKSHFEQSHWKIKIFFQTLNSKSFRNLKCIWDFEQKLQSPKWVVNINWPIFRSLKSDLELQTLENKLEIRTNQELDGLHFLDYDPESLKFILRKLNRRTSSTTLLQSK